MVVDWVLAVKIMEKSQSLCILKVTTGFVNDSVMQNKRKRGKQLPSYSPGATVKIELPLT